MTLLLWDDTSLWVIWHCDITIPLASSCLLEKKNGYHAERGARLALPASLYKSRGCFDCHLGRRFCGCVTEPIRHRLGETLVVFYTPVRSQKYADSEKGAQYRSKRRCQCQRGCICVSKALWVLARLCACQRGFISTSEDNDP